MNHRTPLSVLLPTFNCVATVRSTLESVKWADEILVVDSFSTDGTREICSEYGARIVQHEYLNSAKQKNWAVPQCAHEWVLQIDSDEILDDELRWEIETVLAADSQVISGFRIPRKNYFWGEWLRYGGNYPDYQTRFFRRDAGRWLDREVHAHVQVDGQVSTLHGNLVHSDWPTLAKPLHNLNRYTRYEADELFKRGIADHWLHLTIRPLAVFLYYYFWLQGFRDGLRGFIFAAYMAFYVFVSRAKLQEMYLLGLENSPR